MEVFAFVASGVFWKYINGLNLDSRLHLPSSSAYESLVGNTPLVRLRRASEITGCEVLVKMENMNPGGTGKDRAAKMMLLEAMATGKLPQKNGIVVEGTSGSTGIALACLCRPYGHKLHIVMPDDQADEKRQILESLGCQVTIVPCCAIANKNHYVRVAKKLAEELGGFYVNQFENIANSKIHFEETGPEIFRQCDGHIDAFVMSSGTGGTMAGVSRYLKSVKPSIKIVLADPQGSSLLNYVEHGVCYAEQQSERKLRRHRYDSIVEGIGLDRLTANFESANIDSAARVDDQEILNTAHWLLSEEGLFVGSSSALNIAIACITAKRLGPGHTVVTVVCDHGSRHLSRFWNKEYVKKYNLEWPQSGIMPTFFS